MPTAAKKATARGTTEAMSHLAEVTDRMHSLLMDHADALMGCTENSPGEAELAALAGVIETYERQRWPDGKIPGGKG
jgi:4-hydroxy-3-methylbut-2-en-1-yl diphosphate synthase IspG/GcpE